MTISEMHVWFRQYAQQMGMQNVRAILPEQIDLLINTSITDILNQLIRENIGLTNDRIVTDNSKLGQINAFRTLYNVKLIDLIPPTPTTEETRTFDFSKEFRNIGKLTTAFPKISDYTQIPEYLYIVDFSINYKETLGKQGYTGLHNKKTYTIVTDTQSAVSLGINSLNEDDIVLKNVFENETFALVVILGNNSEHEMSFKIEDDGYAHCIDSDYDNWYLGFNNAKKKFYIYEDRTDIDGSQIYNPVIPNNTTIGYRQPVVDTNGIETNFFPVRLIDDAYLSDTLNDFVLRNRLRSPIIVTYNNGTFDLYIDKFTPSINNGVTYYTLEYGLIPYQLRMSYIAKPAIVKYAEDIGGENVDCNLPESMHVDVLKHAVDLYNTSIQGNLYANQQQQQAQGREMARNQSRPQNEGYQN